MKVSVACGLLTFVLTSAHASGVLTKVAHLDPMELVQARRDFAEPGADPTEAMVAVKFKISPTYRPQQSSRPALPYAQRQPRPVGQEESTRRELDRTMRKLDALYRLKGLARAGKFFKPGGRERLMQKMQGQRGSVAVPPGAVRPSRVQHGRIGQVSRPGQSRGGQPLTPEMIEGIVMRAMDKYMSARQGSPLTTGGAPQQTEQSFGSPSPLGSGGTPSSSAPPFGGTPFGPAPQTGPAGMPSAFGPASPVGSANGRQPVPAPSFFRPPAARQATPFGISPVNQSRGGRSAGGPQTGGRAGQRTPQVMPFRLNPASQTRGTGPQTARPFGVSRPLRGRPSQFRRTGQAQRMQPAGSRQTARGGRVTGAQKPQYRAGQAQRMQPAGSRQTARGGRVMGRPQTGRQLGTSQRQAGKPSRSQYRAGQAQRMQPARSIQTVSGGRVAGPQQSQSRRTGQAQRMQPGSRQTATGGRIVGPQTSRQQWGGQSQMGRSSQVQTQHVQTQRMGPVKSTTSRSFVTGQQSMARAPAAGQVMKPLSGKIIEKPPTPEDLKAAAEPKKADCPPQPCCSPCAPQPPRDCSQSQDRLQSLPLPPPPVLEEVTNPIIPFSPPRPSPPLAKILEDIDVDLDDVDFNPSSL